MGSRDDVDRIGNYRVVGICAYFLGYPRGDISDDRDWTM